MLSGTHVLLDEQRTTLQGPEAVTFDNVTLAHFLDKAQQLAACAEQIKALDAQVLCWSYTCTPVRSAIAAQLSSLLRVMDRIVCYTACCALVDRANLSHVFVICSGARIDLLLQALGESVLRRALEEVQVWGLEKRFVMYTYSSTAGTRCVAMSPEVPVLLDMLHNRQCTACATAACCRIVV